MQMRSSVFQMCQSDLYLGSKVSALGVYLKTYIPVERCLWQISVERRRYNI